MQTIITEYKPHGIWLVLGAVALALLPVHLWVVYCFVSDNAEYNLWLLNPFAGFVGIVVEPIIVFYLLMTVQVVVKPKVVHKRWTLLGMVFDGEEIAIWEPQHISVTRQRFSRRNWRDYGQNKYNTFTEYYINAGYETKTKQIFKYTTQSEARFLGTAIAQALGVPFEDYS